MPGKCKPRNFASSLFVQFWWVWTLHFLIHWPWLISENVYVWEHFNIRFLLNYKDKLEAVIQIGHCGITKHCGFQKEPQS